MRVLAKKKNMLSITTQKQRETGATYAFQSNRFNDCWTASTLSAYIQRQFIPQRFTGHPIASLMNGSSEVNSHFSELASECSSIVAQDAFKRDRWSRTCCLEGQQAEQSDIKSAQPHE
jgi:hypothetical protein